MIVNMVGAVAFALVWLSIAVAAFGVVWECCGIVRDAVRARRAARRVAAVVSVPDAVLRLGGVAVADAPLIPRATVNYWRRPADGVSSIELDRV